MKEKMNVHRALSELKMMDTRLDSAISKISFVTANKASNSKIQGCTVAEYAEKIKSAYQSATDIIRRKEAMKRAVVKSNATTIVTIAGKDYTVAEAIEMKNHGMDMRSTLFRKMQRDFSAANSVIEMKNGDELERRADEHIKTMFGSSDVKDAVSDVSKERDKFIASQTYELIDPVSISDEMEKIRSEITDFTAEVDAVLSVSNATTEIEFEY